MLGKLIRLENTLEPYVFTRVAELEMKKFETLNQYHSVPDNGESFTKVRKGDTWGKEGSYCWFKGTANFTEDLGEKDIYIQPVVGGYEGMLWVDGIPSGIFANKITNADRGNHYCDLLVKKAEPGQSVEVAIEFYSGHYYEGTHPFEERVRGDFSSDYDGIYLCTKNQDIADFIFDLRTLNQMAEKLDTYSFRRADIINCLVEVHKTVYYAPEDTEENIWRSALAKARDIMRPLLEAKNSSSAPYAGLVGHSHMDTAWLWPISETVKKCARTYSNQISLMNQYPEYRFVQSSAYHTEMIRRNYPALFDKITEKVAEGRYEPNGAVWVECDCNITSGESLVRQFVWGQKYTQKYFGYTSNCFWLPDTFGYSGAIPQIMKGCRVDYFLTTKLSWNDTNEFPYETFYWKGIDGTAVFSHFNIIHCWPDPKTLLERIEGRGSSNCLKDKSVAKGRFVSYGYGDGGGGPQFEMIEMARRLKDLEGCPKAEHVSVGEFMSRLETEAVNPPAYKGELYLEMHRGTLTNQHRIKRNNREAEKVIHDLEFLTVQKAVKENAEAMDTAIRPLLETLLVNQFHDILPGTCIERVHNQSYSEMEELIETGKKEIEVVTNGNPAKNVVSVINTLGYDRNEIVYLKDSSRIPEDDSIKYQRIKDMEGNMLLCLANVELPSLGARRIGLKEISSKENSGTDIKSAFQYQDNVLITPFARVEFDNDGTITSFIDVRVDRELRGKGLPLNTFLMAEDVPTEYDNWDVDADYQLKFKPCTVLENREIVSDGVIEFRIRSTYRISDKSIVRQDMVFYASSPRVDFETVIDWNDKHRFLKVGFDTTIVSNTARHEIQFGHCQRPTTRNHSIEQAMFEVLNHKFTDISETRYGVAILNDCKYGISVEGGDLRLSLHKGGCRPDTRGDQGVHRCAYSFLPHIGGFQAETVILPAYSFNTRPIVIEGEFGLTPLAQINSSNIIIETIKPCEDNQKAFIMRLYEAEGTYTNCRIKLGIMPESMELTNLLEETIETLSKQDTAVLTFRPFEIKTLKIGY
jgi:alpha-mannosidase